MAAADILQRISRTDLLSLMEVLKSKFPISAPVYHWLRVQKYWEEKVQGLDVNVMCPRGNWKDGTLVALSSGHMTGNAMQCVLYCPDDAHLQEILQETKMIPWNDVANITNVKGSSANILRNFILKKTTRDYYEVNCHLFFCSVNTALKIQLPEPKFGERVSHLTTDHLDNVCDLWPHYFSQYRPVITAILEHNLSVGVFVTKADGTEELASMALEAEHGAVGMVQTVPKYTGRGFGALAVAHLIRALGEGGNAPHFTTQPSNRASLAMLKKIGFEIPVGNVSHFRFHGPNLGRGVQH